MQAIPTAWFYQGATLVPNILLTHLKQLPIDGEDCLFLSWLQAEGKADYFPLPFARAQEVFAFSEQEVFAKIQKLLEDQVLAVQQVQGPDGKKQDVYSLQPLWDKILLLEKQQDQVKNKVQAQELLGLFEREFGRPLSSFEIENIRAWLDQDQYDPDLVLAALKEAVINRAFSVKYVDRVLIAWEREGIQSQADLLSQRQRLKTGPQTGRGREQAPVDQVPLINWLEEE